MLKILEKEISKVNHKVSSTLYPQNNIQKLINIADHGCVLLSAYIQNQTMKKQPTEKVFHLSPLEEVCARHVSGVSHYCLRLMYIDYPNEERIFYHT